MNNMIIKVLLFLLLAGTAQASNLAGLRSRVSHYLSDSSNLMLPAYIKDSMINLAMMDYCAQFPVHVDTASILVVSGTRMYALDSNYGGRVLSVHKNNREFTELKKIPTDSIPEMQAGVLEYYSVKQNWLILYPRPTSSDTVFYFFHLKPTPMDTDTTTCPILEYLQEPIALLATAKCWMMTDLRQDLAQYYMQLYQETAARMTRTKLERVEP